MIVVDTWAILWDGLRAGDALHMAAALDARAASTATLDGVLAKNAARLKLKLVRL
jgi:hypothetical protein